VVTFGSAHRDSMNRKTLLWCTSYSDGLKRTYRSSTIVFYNTLQHVLAVHISHHQVDEE
jgi:hypothetical protein